MDSFQIRLQDGSAIRFNLYIEAAPKTCEAFQKTLPFAKRFFHAKVSGQEIWIDDAPVLDIIQENASVFASPGEIVIGPLHPIRTKTSKCLGIYYGEGKGFDCCNIFGRVLGEDMPLLANLGEKIWREGTQILHFEAIDS